MQAPLPSQTALEHTGIVVSAIGGVLAARGKRIDLFGVIVLALVTAFGGGTVRDVLVGDYPVAWLRKPEFLVEATATAFITFWLARLRELPKTALLIADAGALALFTIVGASKGVSLNFSAPVCVLLGVVTGVAGGILRDVLIGEVPLVFQPEIHLYATASLFGATAFVILHPFLGQNGTTTFIASVIVFALRLAAIRWKVSLPTFKARE
jgi:uncharacterized membrane protein YeiH